MCKLAQLICVFATGFFLYFGVLEILENHQHFTAQDYLVFASFTMFIAGILNAFSKKDNKPEETQKVEGIPAQA